MSQTTHPDRATLDVSSLPQPYITLNDLIDWVGLHDVKIPADIAQSIKAYGVKWADALAPEHRVRSTLFPPEPRLKNIYRRGTAAGYLFEAFSELDELGPVWRNSLVTGDAVRLRSDERGRAISMLGQIVRDARQVFWSTLNGERPFDPAMLARYPVAMNRSEREWFDALVFETKEILALLYPDPIVSDNGCQPSQEEIDGREAVPQATVKRRSAHPGGLDEKKLEKQKKKYPFIERLLNEKDQPRYLASSDIAKCFGKYKCLSKTSIEWSKTLGDPPAWLEPARMSRPSKGTEAVWHPAMIACMLAHGVPVRSQGAELSGRPTSRLILDRIFDTNVELADWRRMWGRESEFLKDFASVS